MQQKSANRFLWGAVSFVLAALFVLILSRVFQIIFFSPDDIIFERIMSGMITGTPDGHTHFMRYPLSALISLLYRIWDGISWYQVFLMGSVVLSMALVFGRVMHIAKGRRILYLVVTILFAVTLFVADIVHLEWTVISGILGATALFRFVTMPGEMKKGQRVWEYVVCAVLLALCFCLRNTVAYMFIPLAGLCWLRNLLIVMMGKETQPEKKKKITQLVIFLVVCLVVVGAMMLTHILAYGAEDWKAYQDYTKDRSKLFDYYGYPDYNTYAQEYEAAGISPETYNLMKSDYNFVVPCDNFKQIDLKAIVSLAESIHFEDPQVKLQSTLETIRDVLIGEKYILLNAIIVVLLVCNFIAYKDKSVIDVLFIAATACWAAALAFYLSYDGRFPERVIKCLDYGLIMVLLGNLVPFWYVTANERIRKFTPTKAVLSGFLVITLLATAGQTCFGFSKENKKQEKLAVAHMQILQYCAENPDNLYFRDFWSFSQRGQLFLRKEYNADNYQNAGGWIYHSPVYDEMLEKWDCTDLYEAIVENENIYFLTSKDRYHDSIQRINNYYITAQIPVAMEQVDMFQTELEEVYVMKFAAQ